MRMCNRVMAVRSHTRGTMLASGSCGLNIQLTLTPEISIFESGSVLEGLVFLETELDVWKGKR